MPDIFSFAQQAGELLDLVGVIVIFSGVVISVFLALFRILTKKTENLYRYFRQCLGKSILLGLEFLVAGDIIRSITGTPSFTAVGVLVVIILIRSFLSITFDMEIDGCWPWQRSKLKPLS